MRARAFAITATLTLALGIGLSTAVFTVAHALLLRELPVGDEQRIVALWGETRDGRFSNVPFALNDVREFRTRVMARGLALAAAGVLLGMPAALAAGNLLSALLFEINPFDVATLVFVATLLLAVATIASFVPARLSMRIDPMVAMRSDV